MRPEVLNSGYPIPTKVLFAIIRLASGEPVPDAAKINFYRPAFYGSSMKNLTHEVMRGDSVWTVGERELMAAAVSQVNRSSFCVSTHSATASAALSDATFVSSVLSGGPDEHVPEPLRTTLRLLRKLTRKNSVAPDDIRAAFAAGATASHLEQAFAVCFVFNVINRLAEAFSFAQLAADGYRKGANYLLKHGYR